MPLRTFASSPSALGKKSRPSKDPLDSFYSDSLYLPKTAFPLRAEASRREKLFRKRTTDELYEWQAKQTDRPLFVLHDGPPYANGHLHCGHALNKITKDLINRSKLIQGYRVHYTPGFDTHGLPLELKALSSLSTPPSSLTPSQIRSAARAEAEKGIEIQKEEFRSFAVMGDWERPYRTMDWEFEKRQLRVVRDMVGRGLVVTHHRPTLYSPSSRTALAEAELEYRDDHTSRSVYVSFPVHEVGDKLERELEKAGVSLSEEERKGLGLAVWTTTAWTVPSNVAIAVSPTLAYSLVRHPSSPSCLFIVATERLDALSELIGATEPLRTLATFSGSSLLSTTYTDPLSSPSHTAKARPIIPADYVTSTTGTGLVHTAPAHGIEDWEAWRAYHASTNPSSPAPDTLCAVDADGRLDHTLRAMGVERDVVERLAGKDVLKEGTEEVIRLLEERGRLIKEVEVQHKFPYDWRSKMPVIFRASSQWFANLDPIKQSATSALSHVNFFPSRGSRTLEMYVSGRSEWCISRQRAWGVPIPVVYSEAADGSGKEEPLLTPSNIDHIVEVLERNGGTDYWWSGAAEEFVEPEVLERSRREGRVWRKGTDTMDVWFDSGCSWTLLREEGVQPASAGGKEYAHVADVYFEGSDQHRGWFQSSLLTKVASTPDGVEPSAPYKDLVTHGMVLDEHGRKMSKSLGNVMSPKVVVEGGEASELDPAYGTDLLRVWVASVDSSRDVLIGRNILAQTFDGFRKIRNTARFLLGNMADQPAEIFEVEQLSLIERYILHELYQLDKTAREAFSAYEFNKAYQALSAFSNTTLSSFYFEITKDTLYADSSSSLFRRKTLFVLQKVFDTYVSVLAPIAPLLAEEVHHYARGAAEDPKAEEAGTGSVFEKGWPEADARWNDSTVKHEMEQLLALRDGVNALLETARNDKLRIASEAALVLSRPTRIVQQHEDLLKTLLLVSDVSFDSTVDTATSPWSYSADIGQMKATILPSAYLKCPRGEE
ncbi:isoleucyl-tRNA synthetase [Rhodotorula toruloides]|uniref:isoleucine--tRNA ligase n=1 Tax=Rhodotorula toruloides TaxID=5286 RepID=A0A511KMT1_RHOTO|nr:isoleucyl-tRNA synthetase [Rhodotorula toruloides]